jgi:hypothetical protein
MKYTVHYDVYDGESEGTSQWRPGKISFVSRNRHSAEWQANEAARYKRISASFRNVRVVKGS